MVKDNKIVTQDWKDYSSIVDSIMDSLNYELNLEKIELISSTMNITKVTHYDVELEFGLISLPIDDSDEAIDINIFLTCGYKNSMQICLYSSYLETDIYKTTSKEFLYPDIRELVAKILHDPIDQTLHNNKEIQW
jgi:hypothetical protein